MDFLDKLKNIFNIDLRGATFITVVINKNSNNKVANYDKRQQTVSIDPGLANNDQIKFLADSVEEQIKRGDFFLESSSVDLLSRLYQSNEKSGYNEFLGKLKGHIPPDDYRALELSYFMRYEHDQGNRDVIPKHKSDIRAKYGERGSNIANLCTAGYFEEMLIPIHESDPDTFDYHYRLVVEYSAKTLFIHHMMKNQEVEDMMTYRLALAKKYGQSAFYVHCKGKNNISTMDRCIKNYIKEHPETVITSQREIPEQGIKIVELRP